MPRLPRLSPRLSVIAWTGCIALGLAGLVVVQALLAYRTSAPEALLAFVALAAMAAIAARPIYGVYMGMLAVPLEYLHLSLGSVGLSPAEGILIYTAAVAAVRFVVLGTTTRARFPSAYIAFAGLLAVTFSGLVHAEDTFVVFKIGLMWSAFFVLSMLVWGSDRRHVELVLAGIATAGGIAGLVAVSGLSNQRVIAGGTIVAGRAQAGFEHPAVLAFFLVLATPPALVLALRGPRTLRPALAVAAALCVAGLLFSLTRGAIIGLAVALLVLLAWRSFRRMAVVALVVLVGFALVNLRSLESSREIAVVGARLGTLANRQQTRENPRIKIWSTTPSIIAAYPFIGVGQGNFASVSPKYGLSDIGGLPYNHAHDIFLNVAAEMGLIGLALFLWFVIAVARAATRTLKTLRERASPAYPAALAVVAALSGLLVNSLTDYPPRTNVVMAAIMLEIGALLSFQRLAEQPEETEAVAAEPAST